MIITYINCARLLNGWKLKQDSTTLSDATRLHMVLELYNKGGLEFVFLSKLKDWEIKNYFTLMCLELDEKNDKHDKH